MTASKGGIGTLNGLDTDRGEMKKYYTTSDDKRCDFNPLYW